VDLKSKTVSSWIQVNASETCQDYVALCWRTSDGSATSMAYVNFLEQSKAIYDTRTGTCMKYYIQSGEAHIIQTNNMTATISTKSLRNVRLKCILHVIASVFTDGNIAKPDSSE